MGKPKGSLTEGSVAHQLSKLDVGEVRWIETTLEHYAHRQRELNAARSRRPEFMREWVLTTHLYTAVSASRAGDIRFLIRLERTA